MIASSAQKLPTPEGGHLHFQSWLPDAPPRAAVLLVHGVGEHSGRYDWLAQRLAEHGLAVHAWDHRGHGLSSGRRGHIESWKDYRQDLRQALDQARTISPPPLPLFLLGHSMGALVALDATLQLDLPLTGLALCGVPMQPAGLTRPHLLVLARLLSRLWPTFPLRLPIQPDQLTTRAPDLADLATDPLLHGQVTVRWATEALRTLDAARAATPRLSLPLLVLHGGQDPLNRVEGAQWLHQQAGSLDKTLHIYPRSRHEPHQDLEREDLVRDFLTWVLTRPPAT